MQAGFASRLNLLIESTNTSQSALAKQSGVSRAAVNKWTKGGQIDDSNLEKLAEIFNVDPVWLRYGIHTGDTSNQSELHSSIDMMHLSHQDAEVVSWEWDILTNAVKYSENVKRVYGVDIKKNEDFFNLLDPSLREDMNRAYETLIQYGGAHEIDFRVSTDEGARWLTSRATSIRENDKTVKIVGITLDNTLRKRNELNAAQYEELFKFLLGKMAGTVLFCDQYGTIVYSNLSTSDVSYINTKVELEGLFYRNIEPIKQALGAREEETDACSIDLEGRIFQLESVGCYMALSTN